MKKNKAVKKDLGTFENRIYVNQMIVGKFLTALDRRELTDRSVCGSDDVTVAKI